VKHRHRTGDISAQIPGRAHGQPLISASALTYSNGAPGSRPVPETRLMRRSDSSRLKFDLTKRPTAPDPDASTCGGGE